MRTRAAIATSALLAAVAPSAAAQADELRLMECTFYDDRPLAEDVPPLPAGYRIVAGTVLFEFNVDRSLLTADVARQGETDWYRFDGFERWQVFSVNPNATRVVAVSAAEEPDTAEAGLWNAFRPTVLVVELDFAEVRLKYQGFGALNSFDALVYDPISHDCRRTN